MSEAQRTLHPIRVVVNRTGLSPDLIRVWERRYEAVQPRRSSTNRRLYTDDDVERLLLYARARKVGRQLGALKDMSNPQIEQLLAEDEAAISMRAAERSELPSAVSRRHFDACLSAAERLDAADLDRALHQAVVELSLPRLCEDLISPLMRHLGRQWSDGGLRPPHEHLVTSRLQTLLGTYLGNQQVPATAPALVATTPPGQRHELGAMMAASIAALDGWRTTYLGPDLPLTDVAAAMRTSQARVLAMSLVFPVDDPDLERDLGRLRDWLDERAVIVVGGRAASEYTDALTRAGAIVTTDLSDFRARLRTVRSGR